MKEKKIMMKSIFILILLGYASFLKASTDLISGDLNEKNSQVVRESNFDHWFRILMKNKSSDVQEAMADYVVVLGICGKEDIKSLDNTALASQADRQRENLDFAFSPEKNIKYLCRAIDNLKNLRYLSLSFRGYELNDQELNLINDSIRKLPSLDCFDINFDPVITESSNLKD